MESSSTSTASLSAPAPTHPNIFLKGLPPHFQEADILSLCSRWGGVTSVRLVAGADGAAGHCFVRFESLDASARAIEELNGREVGGYVLDVKRAEHDVQPKLVQALVWPRSFLRPPALPPRPPDSLHTHAHPRPSAGQRTDPKQLVVREGGAGGRARSAVTCAQLRL